MSAKSKDLPWQEYESLWVEEVPGEPFRYRVQSASDPEQWYLVDLTQRGGQGSCQCVHFQMVAFPNWRRLQRRIPYAPHRQGVTDCRHIEAAKQHCWDTTFVRMLAAFENGIPSPTTKP